MLKRLLGIPLVSFLSLGALPSDAVTTRIDEPHRVQDLAYGESLFDYYQNRYFESISTLRLRQTQGRFANDQAKAQILLGGMYVSYGLYDDAEKIFNELLPQSVSPQTKNDIWLQLATIYYHRANLNKAAEILDRPLDKPTPDQSNKRLLLLALIQLEQKQSGAAIANLSQINPDAPQSTTAQFNLGVAYAGTGQYDKAEKYFSAVSTQPFDDNVTAAIKERSALALGVSYLKNEKWKEARTAFKEVRLTSQYSNQALLGLGWSYFGEKQDIKALTPWMELLKRDPIDRAVQEAYLQIAYVFEEHGALQTASDSYQRALATYKSSHERVNSTREFIAQSDWLNQLKIENNTADPFAASATFELPKEALSKHLYPFYASNSFQAAWRSYQESYRLKQTLAYWREQTPIYLDIVQSNQQKLAKLAPSASQNLAAYQSQLNVDKTRANQLSAKLDDIIKSNNILGTASESQLAFNSKLNTLQTKINALPKTSEYNNERETLAHLKGVFSWDLQNTALQRRWDAQKLDKSIHSGLDEAESHLQAAATAKQRAEEHFSGFNQRIGGLSQRMDGVDKRIDALLHLQEQNLRVIVLAELDRYEQHLKQLTAQTNLAIARMHDSAFMQQYRPESIKQEEPVKKGDDVPKSLIEAIQRLMHDDPLKEKSK